MKLQRHIREVWFSSRDLGRAQSNVQVHLNETAEQYVEVC